MEKINEMNCILTTANKRDNNNNKVIDKAIINVAIIDRHVVLSPQTHILI